MTYQCNRQVVRGFQRVTRDAVASTVLTGMQRSDSVGDPNGAAHPVVNGHGRVVSSFRIHTSNLSAASLVWTRQPNPDMFNWDCGEPRHESNCPENAGTDVDFGASPILVDLDGGHQMILAGQKSAVVWGFDPDRQG